MYYINKLTLMAINQTVIKRAGKSSAGVQYPEGLDIVTEQPKQVVFGQELYPNIWLKSAFILQKITKKHVFVDGNKRTALAATTFFLRKNGYDLKFSNEEGLEFILAVTNSEDSEKNMKLVADWLQIHSRKLNENN
ncbi:type II toxin-antitoxin system death-on-curing family toxin [Lactobacillus amylovorus]|uniref:type II toxin-antitoxin system death-on-curing family toxin n=1 Tax=Lactobacillus amylovorus TaxID=1604 RepID=UPI00232AB53C|nr:type II toxin-antitoxin system death-on-curing family toxin [Lactobacillus amylovorus]MDB6245401.1 type II toxin-antitoxin system death-on-curing family toxin [Lactobacillus amylovorus]MDB6249186.1 type II toxin-antitoxin system death-on-curing family toxin [Lactobacillus amylovorus]